MYFPLRLLFLGDRLQNGSPYAIGPLSVCPVCAVGVLWPNGRMIKMKLGMVVGFGVGHIVLYGNPAHPPPKKKGRSPPIFGSCLLWPQMVAHLSYC